MNNCIEGNPSRYVRTSSVYEQSQQTCLPRFAQIFSKEAQFGKALYLLRKYTYFLAFVLLNIRESKISPSFRTVPFYIHVQYFQILLEYR